MRQQHERQAGGWPVVPVVIVTYRAEQFIAECLASLRATGYPNLKLIVVDNASPDNTVETVQQFADAPNKKLLEDDSVRLSRLVDAEALKMDGKTAALSVDLRYASTRRDPATADITIVQAGSNRGFAAGVNIGLEVALADPGAQHVWILNPDTVVDPSVPFNLVRKANSLGDFAVIGSRVVYRDRPDVVQTDGGRLHPVCGTAVSVNIGASLDTPMPDAQTLSYISGVSMFASRAFVERAGPMAEHWFLYFEEIDWQLRRDDLPLALEPDAIVRHSAGASIGSASVHKAASPVSVYFTCRNLLPFVWRSAPFKLPFAYLIAYYKLVRQWGPTRANTLAALHGLHGLPAPSRVRRALGDAQVGPPALAPRGFASGGLARPAGQ